MGSWWLTLLAEGNTQHSLDLSSAINLKSIVFKCEMSNHDVDWIAVAVESIKSSHVKEMGLRMPGDLATHDARLSNAVHTQWLALDKALVKYLTARSFKLEVMVPSMTDKTAFETWVEHLLPNLFGKKMLEGPK
jgi:hypothetical protein